MWFGVLMCLSFSANAASFEILNGTVDFNANALNVAARYELSLNDVVADALHHGIKIKILSRVNLYRVRRLMLDKKLAAWQRGHQLGYHSLSGRYQLLNLQTSEQSSFASLETLLNEIEDFRFQTELVAETLPDSRRGYRVDLQVRLDHASLPTPLRVIALVKPEWRLKSDQNSWYVGK